MHRRRQGFFKQGDAHDMRHGKPDWVPQGTSRAESADNKQRLAIFDRLSIFNQHLLDDASYVRFDLVH